AGWPGAWGAGETGRGTEFQPCACLPARLRRRVPDTKLHRRRGSTALSGRGAQQAVIAIDSLMTHRRCAIVAAFEISDYGQRWTTDASSTNRPTPAGGPATVMSSAPSGQITTVKTRVSSVRA